MGFSTVSGTVVDQQSAAINGGAEAVYRPVRIWNCGKSSFDQTHVFVANYTWDLPKVRGKATLDDRTFARWFDTGVFGRPARGDFGNAPKDVFRGPGVANWDLSAFKNIPLRGERLKLQFRWETYNTFNHTQYLGVDNAARFDVAGNQVNQRFGQVISARNPRVMQGSLRLIF